MKTKHTIALCLLLATTACASIQEESVNSERIKSAADEVFYATLEQSGGADATKVYADENLKVLWNADDRITIYNRYTYGYQYAFQGITGDSAGAFLKKEDDAEFVTGNPLEHIYAVYPYREDNKINNSGQVSLTWPSTQTYKAESFGIGANVMVSVTDNNQLRFRNVGGYLAIKLYGDNVSVSSITLRGNNGEKLSGRATITCAPDADPALTFQSASSESLRLECPMPVLIGNSAESATTFWMVVPPTEFTQGFNITVRTSNGLVFYKSKDIAYDIERNTLCRMAAIEVIPSDIVPFADANFKAYCIANFDTDSDGEISISEALAVTDISVATDNIESLLGVEFFENITSLQCNVTMSQHGGLTSLDVSNNTDLIYLNCCYNQLSTLDVSNNTALTALFCWSNQLTTLNVSNNLALTQLHCESNQLTVLDVSNNSALTDLSCRHNQLTTLDVSKNTELTYMECYNNRLTTLDVRNNTALRGLYCHTNHLTSLDVSNNTALVELTCGENQLTSLVVSNSPALTILSCYSNQLTGLDISNNTALTKFNCWSNQLTDLDVSNNTNLTSLHCDINQLTNLDVSNNTALTDLGCSHNQLTTLDVSNNIALTWLQCDNNQLTDLDVSNNTALTQLGCSSNQLTSLDVSNNTALTSLYCYSNQLLSIDVNNNTSLTILHCQDNQLTSLDVSNNPELTYLICYSNPYLTQIWLKTGQTIPDFSYDTTVAQIQYKD